MMVRNIRHNGFQGCGDVAFTMLEKDGEISYKYDGGYVIPDINLATCQHCGGPVYLVAGETD